MKLLRKLIWRSVLIQDNKKVNVQGISMYRNCNYRDNETRYCWLYTYEYRCDFLFLSWKYLTWPKKTKSIIIWIFLHDIVIKMSGMLQTLSLIFESYVMDSVLNYVPYGRTVSSILFLINVVWIYFLRKRRETSNQKEYR